MPYICLTCANGDTTSVSLDSNGLKGTIPLSLGSLTGLNYMDLAINNLDGTIPSILGSLIELTAVVLDENNLEGTIPSSLASLTRLTYLSLQYNTLTGLVPPLPFKQYSDWCGLDVPEGCTEPNCNHFKCPLPAGSKQCDTVHCK